MNSFLIETSVIIDYLKGKENARTLINAINGRLTSSYFCLAELYEGIKRVKNPQMHEQAALEYFASLSTIYGLDFQIAKQFGELRASLKQRGNLIEDMDIFIAVTCIVHDLELVTFNKKHFAHIGELKVV